MKSEEMPITTEPKKQARVPATMNQKFNWFKSVLRDKTLSPGAKNVAAALMIHHNDKTGQCNPKQGSIADAIGMHRPAVNAGIKQLRDAGWIDSITTRGASHYTLNIAKASVEEDGDRDERCPPIDTAGVREPIQQESADRYSRSPQIDTRNHTEEPSKGTTKLNPEPVVFSEAELAWLDEVGLPAEGKVVPDVQPEPSPLPATNDDQPESSEAVRIGGLTIPGAVFRDWEETLLRIDVRAELAGIAPWACREVSEERRVPVLANMLAKRNKAAHADFLARKAEAEGRASAPPPLVATSRFQFLTDTDGNTVSGGAASAVPVVRLKNRYQL